MDADYDDRYAMKFGALEQEYEELQAEAEEVSMQLQKARDAKRLLLAEVKFLRKRAMMLREMSNRERIQDSYYTGDSSGEMSNYGYAPSRVSMGRMVQDSDTNILPSKTHFGKSSKSRGHSRNQGVSGVLKSSPKLSPGNYQPTKKAGKRKISWQDVHI